MAKTGRGDASTDLDDAGDGARAVASQRVDKWLWHARVVKTRTLAAKLVETGHIRRNRERLTKSSDLVKLGDVLTIALTSRVVVWRVTGFAERRGGAPEAALLYEDLTARPGG